MEGKPVTFTATEIEGLEQIISAGHKWLDGSNPAYPNLILKLGRAFLEVQNGAQSQELYVSEMEAWYLREIAPTNMRVKGETVGLTIKGKLYPLLLDFEAEMYSAAAGIRYGSSTMDEPLSREDALADSVAQETESASDITDASESGEACHGVEHGLEPEAMTDLQPPDVGQDHRDGVGELGAAPDNIEIPQNIVDSESTSDISESESLTDTQSEDAEQDRQNPDESANSAELNRDQRND